MTVPVPRWVRQSSAIAVLGLFEGSIGCSGRVDVVTEHASPPTSSGGASGGVTSDAGGSGAGALGGSRGGAPPQGGAVGSGGSLGSAGECVSDADCPPSAGPCVAAACQAGRCTTAALARGTPVNAPVAVCHASVCDGTGRILDVIDPTNVSLTSPVCAAAACDDTGAVTQIPLAAGSACSEGGARICDGAGRCVMCLVSSDCATGLVCVEHACVTTGCSDGILDGDETDVDCGGVCPPCAQGRACRIDQDCASDACEGVTHICLATTCIDQILDGSETDVDCGGSCSPCTPNHQCAVNADCTTARCDPQTLICGGNECLDGRQNGLETDVDCGGADACVRCRIGGHCSARTDCQAGLQCDKFQTPPVCAR